MHLLTVILVVVGHIWNTAATEDILIVTAGINVSVGLNCTAIRKPGVDYRAVRWYKEGVDPRLTGLVSRTPPGGSLRWYVDADTRVSLEYPSLSLLLPPVSCSDSGVYQCYMAAPVGEQNREGRVRLSVTGCPTAPALIPETNRDIIIEKTPLRSEPVSKDGYLMIFGAGGVLMSALVVFFLSYRNLKNASWRKNKTLEKELGLDPNSPPEKQDLLWISALGPPPKKSEITAA